MSDIFFFNKTDLLSLVNRFIPLSATFHLFSLRSRPSWIEFLKKIRAKTNI
jgi:hypothetical protein